MATQSAEALTATPELTAASGAEVGSTETPPPVLPGSASAPTIAPAYAQAEASGGSTRKLTQVASLTPNEGLAGVSNLQQARPTAAGYSFPDYKSRGAAFLSRDHECLARAMFFESNRSSRAGLIAVGSVVMNRLESGIWGNTVCQVVGAPKQFAPGVLSRSMNSEALPDVMEAAHAVLKGERHPKIYKDVMYFHTAGYRYPYDNMHYVVVAGGNSFYEKRRRMRGIKNTPQGAVLAAARGPSLQAFTAVAKPAKALRKPSAEVPLVRKAAPAKLAKPAPVVADTPVAAPSPAIQEQAPIAMPIAARFAVVDTTSSGKSARVRKPTQN